MRRRDFAVERLSDVKNFDEEPLYPGQYTPIDSAILYPGGLPSGLPL